MIWSVSTLTRSSGATDPVCDEASMLVPRPRARRLRPECPVVASQVRTSTKWPAIGGGRRHLRADQVGAPALALAPLEVAVGGRGAALARLQDVRVHAQAHRAAGLAPVEAGGREDLVQPLRLGLRLDPHRAGHDHGVDLGVRPACPARTARRRRAGPRCGRWCRSRGRRGRWRCPRSPCRPSGPCTPGPARPPGGRPRRRSRRVGHAPGDRDDHAGVRPPGDERAPARRASKTSVRS